MRSRPSGKPTDERDLEAPELFINRELSALEFNQRVLAQATGEDVELFERLKFLAIAASNLDHFFMVRIAGLKRQIAAGVAKRDLSGMTPPEQLEAALARARRMADDVTREVESCFGDLADKGLSILAPERYSAEQEKFVESYFESQILPALTPIAAENLESGHSLPLKGINVALLLAAPAEKVCDAKIAVVSIPESLPRFVTLPAGEGLSVALVEDVVRAHTGRLFPGYKVLSACLFKVTRDADITVEDDAGGDLLEQIEDAVRQRMRRAAVRLEMSCGADARVKRWLMESFKLREADVYESDGMMDQAALWEITARPGFEDLKAPAWPPQTPVDLAGRDSIWEAVQEQDVLLCHPYESFEPVVGLLEAAAEDPNVLAIKQTLYRTGGESAVTKALARAAENGKQVTVLVELRARFDERTNVNWARRLEDAGCQVLYGIAGYKTHAKLLMITRREAHGVRRYVHAATGNYNETTARAYADVALLTAERDFGADASAFFNLLTGYSQEVGWRKFAVSPMGLRRRFLDLIEREIAVSGHEQGGLIMAKMNALQDKEICQALYRASMAGVRVRLNCRGICCLRPGVAGVSDNIEVVSIVDRLLEHARIYYFGNGGHEEVYLSSSDWMERNLDRRLEVLFPVSRGEHKKRLVGMLETYFADNVKAQRLRPDGTYEPVRGAPDRVRAQEVFYREAVEAARSRGQGLLGFQPLSRGDFEG